jgi:formylglycine-generating enzyme required for sulfatase activity
MVVRYYYAIPAALCALAVALTAFDGAGAVEVNSVGMKLVRIQPGSFEMGVDSTPFSKQMVSAPKGTVYDRSTEGDYDETPVHKVTLTHPFYIDETEVTVEQFRQFRPGFQSDPHFAPYAAGVSWNDATAFCAWLSHKEGKPYRLPTEAEWEYACRAGTTTDFYFGDDASRLGDYAWYAANSGGKYQKVGTKKPNAWGLYDMLGNVMEWTLDQYAPYPSAPQVNPWVKATQPYPNAVRGGSWNDPPEMLRCAARVASDASWKQQDPQLPKSIWYLTDAQWLGFRLVRPTQVPTVDEMYRYWNSGLEHDEQ